MYDHVLGQEARSPIQSCALGFCSFLLKDGRGFAFCGPMSDAGGVAVDVGEILLLGTTSWGLHEMASFLVDLTRTRGL